MARKTTPAPTTTDTPVVVPVPTGPQQRALNLIRSAALREGRGGLAPEPTAEEIAAAISSAATSYAAHRASGAAGDLSPAAEKACAERRAAAMATRRAIGAPIANPMAVIGCAKANRGASLDALLAAGAAPRPAKARVAADADAGPRVDAAPTPTPARAGIGEEALTGLLEALEGLPAAQKAAILAKALAL